jgi:hypothetical protein
MGLAHLSFVDLRGIRAFGLGLSAVSRLSMVSAEPQIISRMFGIRELCRMPSNMWKECGLISMVCSPSHCHSQCLHSILILLLRSPGHPGHHQSVSRSTIRQSKFRTMRRSCLSRHLGHVEMAQSGK